MAHKALIGGTVYNVKNGKTLIGGTSYNVKSGKTLIGGTAYNINFVTAPQTAKYAMLYSDGSFVFQKDDTVAPGKTLTASYTGYEDTSSPPWNGQQKNFKSVSFDGMVAPTNMAMWFYNSRNMVANISNFTNLVMDKVTYMRQSYSNCLNLTGSPVCGSNVIDFVSTYYNCRNLTGQPVCGRNVNRMFQTYSNCVNLTGTPVFGNNVTNISYAYSNCSNLNAGNIYIYAKNITNAYRCFYLKNYDRCYNLYVRAGSTTLNTLLKNSSSDSIVGYDITWKQSGTMYYNYKFNINIYPTL